MKPHPPLPVESAVAQRYSAAAKAPEASLCCAVEYDANYLKVIPTEAVEKDYGCGDPSRHLKPVVSNCVLNLVRADFKRRAFGEVYRVLKEGGRAVISDIVSDEAVPAEMQENAELWNGCISGALTEADFLGAFVEAGFHGIEILKRDEKPWQTVQGIDFRSVTVRAFKGKQGACCCGKENETNP